MPSNGSPSFLSRSTAAFILRWMSFEDSNMDTPWNDSDSFIENRSGERNRYLARELLSRWDGELPRPTFVFGIYAPLDGPVPPFRGWGVVQDYPGDNPDTRMNPGAPAPLINTPVMAPQSKPGPQSPGQRSGSVSTDDSRRHDSYAHEEELRYRASHSMRDRPRMRDEPAWGEGNRDSRRPTPYPKYAFEGTRSRNGLPPMRSAPPPQPRVTPQVPPGMVRMVPDPVRTFDNPDLSMAPRGPDGHPQSEWAIRQAGPDATVDDDCPPPDLGYAAAEEERIAKARVKPLKEGRTHQPVWREDNPRLLGRFYRTQITTLEQAFNLISFLDAGQQEARELFETVTQNLAAFPLHFRTEGEAYLLRNQQDIEAAWWVTITGRRRASRQERHPGPAQARRQTAQGMGPFTPHPPTLYTDRGNPPHYQGGASSSSASSSLTRPFSRIDDPTRPHPRVDAPRAARYGPRPPERAPPRPPTPVLSQDDSQGYLGRSPPNVSDVAPALSEFIDISLVPNTRWTAGALAGRYQHTHPSMWARGIMNSSGHIATTLGDTARREDVLAHHTNLALAPDHRRALNHQHHQFTQAVVNLFSVRGLFAHIVQEGGYPMDMLPMRHYDSLTDNMTIFLAAAWYVTHGIVPGSPDVLALEEFARARRNMQAGNEDVTNEEWAVDDMDAVATLGFTAPRIPLWADINHAPPRPLASASGATAVGPAPGTGLEGSAHAVPMEDIVNGPAEKPVEDKPE
ncbi:hypothetical protein C8R47DRAFT_1230210 [Mycena vitilis]|nr:hypothetical protein C8R47DRAFT_1230210 [Mycena vitilis]